MRRIRPARARAMIRVGVALVALCLGGGAAAETVVLDHVTLFDGTGSAPRADQARASRR